MDNNSHNGAECLSNGLQSYFSKWHPLGSNWLDVLTGDIRAVSQIAQQSLIESNRSEKELANALRQLKEWKNKDVLVAYGAPQLIERESLGCQLNIGTLIEFLIAHEEINSFRHYEFVALALLQEIYGLAELEVVAGKGDLGPATQYLAMRIAKLYIALLLLRMMNNTQPEKQEVFEEMAAYLFMDEAQEL